VGYGSKVGGRASETQQLDQSDGAEYFEDTGNAQEGLGISDVNVDEDCVQDRKIFFRLISRSCSASSPSSCDPLLIAMAVKKLRKVSARNNMSRVKDQMPYPVDKGSIESAFANTAVALPTLIS